MRNYIIIGVVLVGIFLLAELSVVYDLKKSGKDVYQVSVYNPSTQINETYFTENVITLPNGSVVFKDYFGIEHTEQSLYVKILKY